MDEEMEKYVDEHSRFLPLHGLKVHYRDEGKGFPFVLLHGTLSSLHTFDGWAKALSDEFRIIRLDLPGFGLTGIVNGFPFTLSSYVRFLGDFLAAIGIRKCFIAGSSLGGWISWEYTYTYPKKISKMVLIDSVGYYIEPGKLPLPFRMAQTPFINRFMKYAVSRPLVERILRDVYGNSTRITKPVINRYYDLFLYNSNQKSFIDLANAGYDIHSENLKKIKTPTLILWGDKDKWIPLEHGYRLTCDIPNSQIIVYEGVGHIPMEEIPEQSAADVSKFLMGKFNKK